MVTMYDNVQKIRVDANSATFITLHVQKGARVRVVGHPEIVFSDMERLKTGVYVDSRPYSRQLLWREDRLVRIRDEN